MPQKQSKIVSISLPPKVERKLERFSDKNDKSRSSVVADALKYYFLSEEFNVLQQELSLRAKVLGVKDEKDADKIVHAGRK